MNNELLYRTQNNLISNLIQAIEQNDPKNFKLLLSKNLMYINEQLLNFLFFHALNSKKENIFSFRFLSILINFGVDPNFIIDDIKNKNMNNNKDPSNKDFGVGKSILMLACEKSNLSLVKDLCETNKRQKLINVNYFDKNGRNALFYLRGGNDDGKIIDLLVKKGIDVNRRDKDDNTPLHFVIMNTMKEKLVCDLIEIGGANFMLKNKNMKNGLDLIKEIIIIRNNHNFNHINSINNFDDIKRLINLLKNKLSIKLYPSNKLNNNNAEIDSNNNINNFRLNNNLIKLSSLSTVTNQNNENNIENNNNELNHNLFVKINPLSLIVDTQFNDNNNISSNSKKIEYYTQMNRNKKYFLNILKDSENNIKEKSKLIEEEIKKKKLEIKELQKKLKEKGNKIIEINDNYENKLNTLKKDINDIKNIIQDKKKKLLEDKNDNLSNIQPASKSLYKYKPMILRENNNKEYIYNQLQIDLIDFMTYIHNRNNQLEETLHKLNDLIQKSVKNCLGDDYQLKMYGSRATKLCLPWSDIDYVLSCVKNNHFEPLKILYEYLLGINDKFYVDIKYIAGASIPVLKIFTNKEYHKISLDISIENLEHHGEECVNYIKQKIKEYEVLTPLTFALKTILQKAYLNDPYKGGLSSYGVILLIIHYLNVQQKKGNDISMKSLGKLFYDILHYYGTEYDIANPIILGENENIQKIISIHQFQLMKSEFILVDPLNISNNVARNTRQYQNIKLAFKIGYVSCMESCECGCHYQYDGINIKEEGCEHNLLERIFNDVKRDWIFQ